MRATLLLLGLTAALATFALITYFRGTPPPPPFTPPPNPIHRGPEEIAGLSGRSAELEVVIVRRHFSVEQQRFGDATLGAMLGLEANRNLFVDVYVTNISDHAVDLSPAAARFETRGGPGQSSFALTDLPAKDVAAVPVLAALAGPNSPLEPGRFRRLVLGVETHLAFETITSGSYAGVSLEPHFVTRKKLEEYMDKATPPLGLLAEVVVKSRIPRNPMDEPKHSAEEGR